MHKEKLSLPSLTITAKTKAITIHGPWVWAIGHGYKRVENRIWETPYRGELIIHAGGSSDSDEAATAVFEQLGLDYPPSFPRKQLYAAVDLTEILPLDDYLAKYGDDPMNRAFAIGPFCWVLSNARLFEPIRCPGNFQLWNVKNQLNRLSPRR